MQMSQKHIMRPENFIIMLIATTHNTLNCEISATITICKSRGMMYCKSHDTCKLCNA